MNPPAAKTNHDSADSNDNAEGVDDRAIARVEFIASELEKRVDSSFYKGYQTSYSSGGAKSEHHYDASITKSASCSNICKKSRLMSNNSVELISSSQYRKKRKTTFGGTKSAGYEYLSLANDCYLPHLYNTNSANRISQRETKQNVKNPVVPFIPSISPIGMMSLAQAVAFYPKARIIVEAVSPLKVVFANSAYYRLSGLSSGATLNFALNRLIRPIESGCSFNAIIKCVQKMEEGAHTSVYVTTQSVDSLSGNQVYGELKCQMYAFPVVGDVNYAHAQSSGSILSLPGLRNVTHFLLEFTYLDTALDLLEDMMDTSVKSSEQAFTLMG